MTTAPQDLFVEAREKLKIADAWQMLGFDGEPKASCRSPFREDRHPSFSIHHDGTAWTDHATGEGGDVIEFIRLGIGGDHREVRDWLRARIGTAKRHGQPTNALQPSKAIEWPSQLVEGVGATWDGFARLRGYTYPATWALVQSGILRFCTIDGVKCFVVTDESRRAAEIRKLDGKHFSGSKTYPLRGVDKSWLPGMELLRQTSAETAVLITEGATDLLAAVDIYTRYRRNHGGKLSWQPVALLGAKCRNLHSEAARLIRGRHVRIVPDADPAGDGMAEHWTTLLRRIGCPVDVVTLPRNSDLTDHLSTLSATDLFSR